MIVRFVIYINRRWTLKMPSLRNKIEVKGISSKIFHRIQHQISSKKIVILIQTYLGRTRMDSNQVFTVIKPNLAQKLFHRFEMCFVSFLHQPENWKYIFLVYPILSYQVLHSFCFIFCWTQHKKIKIGIL